MFVANKAIFVFLFSSLFHFVLRIQCLITEGTIKTTKIQILRFDGVCNGSPDAAILYRLVNVKIEEKSLVVNSTIEVTKDITDLSLKIDVEKCRSLENPDTCQNVYSVAYKDLCSILEVRSKLWTPFVEAITPKWECPLKKGVYKQTNGKFDITPALLMPRQEWYWKSDAKLLDKKGKIISCYDIRYKVKKIE